MLKRTDVNQVFQYPAPGDRVTENPPCFIWISEGERSVIRVTDSQNREVWRGETVKNYIVPERAFDPGRYIWSVNGEGAGEFEMTADAVTFLRPDAAKVFESVPDVRPRQLFCAEDIPQLIKSRKNAVNTLRRNVALALTREMPEPPMFHIDGDALPYREYFGRHRDYVDRDLIACATAYRLLSDRAAGEHAKRLFLTLCSWNPDGPCSLDDRWGDEVGLSHARCFPAAFDLLYDLLDENQMRFCARAVAAYARQCLSRLTRLDFCSNPGSSHAGRLPAYLGEAAMTLKGTGVVSDEELKSWLGYALDIFGGIFPFYGRPDGGWAEGMFYASSYTKWFLPFINAVRRFSGADFLCRPFYRNYIEFLRHFCPPGAENHPFGDGYWCKSEDEEWPGFMAQNPYRVYADAFGTETEKRWSEAADDAGIFRLHILDAFLPEGEHEGKAPEFARARAFYDTGLVSLAGDDGLRLLARCSKFEASSHRHADQGSFALMAEGTALISPSGYFGRRYGSRHHFEYTRQSMAHNTLLIDGAGQEYSACGQRGRVLSACDEGERLTAVIDPSGAYGGRMKKWLRSFTLEKGLLTVTDEVELEHEGRISYMLHALSRPEATESGAIIERGGFRLTINGSLGAPQITDSFPIDINAGEPEKYHVSMPQQFHMRWETRTGVRFKFIYTFRVEKL